MCNNSLDNESTAEKYKRKLFHNLTKKTTIHNFHVLRNNKFCK